MAPRLVIFFLALLLTSCGEPHCTDQRSFSSQLFQQTWFVSEVPGTNTLGVAFSDSDGLLYAPKLLGHFHYCAEGKTLHVYYGDFWKSREDWTILDLNQKTLILRFEDGRTVTYYRAGR